ncbi:hypothetical protein LLEC1_03357 [Akanthomyces lecanii]|uniref:Protein kinase domain-containing protein n=1 Tax=Cordyceps confragosa TaxID=2714763 RepID=A0A179IGW1_CORDF|nr:hypothetical protein LLEC1_03357 [Akanthomyces lecanii]
MPARDHRDHRPPAANTGSSGQSVSSGISKPYAFLPHRLALANGRAINRTTSRNRQIQIWWEKEQRRSAPATLPDRLGAENESSSSSRDHLENAHRDCLPGARIIIARPPSVRHQETVFSPLLRPAEFISQTPDGRSILGVLQRIEDVFFSIRVPFLAVPLDLQTPIKKDELRCILSYNPASDECEFFCNSHDVAIIGERSSKSYLVRSGNIQNIEPGMWTIAVPGNPVVWTPMSPGDSSSQYRPLVEFLLLKRKYSTTITRPEAAGDHATTLCPGGCGNMVTRSSTATPVEGTVAEFIMGTVDPRSREKTLPPEGPFYQLQDGETIHVVTSPAGSSNAAIEQGYSATAEAYKVTRLQKIDKNTSSSVFACIHSKLPHTTLVAKALNVRPKTRSWVGSLARHWLNEMEILRALDHKNIVKILEWDARFYTVYLEHLPGSLAHYPRNNPGFTHDDAARILADVSSALAYLEEQGVSHNDIKPRNISYAPMRGATRWMEEVCEKVDEELDREDPLQLVVAWMLEQDPEHRLTAKEVVAELEKYKVGER